ncbi:MAG: bile acid:sodium symporter, partial [Parasphingopyxis sp.]
MQRLASILVPDRFIVVLLAMVGVAALLPARDGALDLLGAISTICIVMLFFVHGARLSRQAVLGGFTRLKLHLAIVGFTFLAFPLLGLALTTVAARIVDPAFIPGILFLCALPTT